MRNSTIFHRYVDMQDAPTPYEPTRRVGIKISVNHWTGPTRFSISCYPVEQSQSGGYGMETMTLTSGRVFTFGHGKRRTKTMEDAIKNAIDPIADDLARAMLMEPDKAKDMLKIHPFI